MMRILGLGLLGLALFAAEPGWQQPKVSTTEHFDFAPGGTIKIDGSFGCLSVEGWDRPEVEVTATRLMSGFYAGAARDRAMQKLQAVKVKSERRSDTELAISTEVPHNSWLFAVPLASATRTGIDMEYMIRVPRGSHLAIHHGNGSVIIADVSGEVEASSTSGDVMVMLPDPGPYAIDAKARIGTIYSDFGDTTHTGYLIGERFSVNKPPATKVFLRTGIGSISIQEISAGGY